MTTWAIGDVHGCYRTWMALLSALGWRPGGDRLWLVGDLVGRGQHSLEALRFAREHEEDLRVVLGNHDLHLLARAAGVAQARRHDRLEEVLNAPDADELMSWLARRPLLYRRGRHLLLHAGLLPEWTADEAEQRARIVESALASEHGARLLAALRRDPAGGPHTLPEAEILRTLRALVLLRTVGPDGEPFLGFTGPPEEAPEGCTPWMIDSRFVFAATSAPSSCTTQSGISRGDQK